MENWLYWKDFAHSPSYNMAADEAMLLSADEIGCPMLRFYEWDRKAVSIGYVQQRSAAPEGYASVRRPTGGGIVYHDFDFTYSVAFPSSHWINTVNRVESYDWLNRSVQKGLEGLSIQTTLSSQEIPHSVDRLTMVCFTNPTKYDIMLNGRKVGGSAQRRTREGLLHQGSLHFGGPLPVSREMFQQAILNGIKDVMTVEFIPYQPTELVLRKAEELEAQRYSTAEWNDRR